MSDSSTNIHKNFTYAIIGIVLIVFFVVITLNYVSTHPVKVSLDSKLTGMVISENTESQEKTPTMAPCAYAYLRQNFPECTQ